MKKYKQLPHQSDLALKIYGRNRSELIENSLLGLSSLITDLRRIRKNGNIAFSIREQSFEESLIRILNEAIFIFDTQKFIWSKARSELVSDPYRKWHIKLEGEIFDQVKHEINHLVKAATYHQFKIEEKNGLLVTKIIFDS